MKHVIIIIVLLTKTFISFGQTNELSENRETMKSIGLGLQGIGFSVETPFTKHFTVEFTLGAGGGYDISTNQINYKINLFDPAVYFAISPRYYYNAGKKIINNQERSAITGNYLGMRLKYTSRGISENSEVYDALLGNIHWGMQRSLGNRWLFNFHAGVGYALDATDLQNSSGTIYPALDFKFSYRLKNRSR